jgi:hypothetical protein
LTDNALIITLPAIFISIIHLASLVIILLRHLLVGSRILMLRLSLYLFFMLRLRFPFPLSMFSNSLFRSNSFPPTFLSLAFIISPFNLKISSCASPTLIPPFSASPYESGND